MDWYEYSEDPWEEVPYGIAGAAYGNQDSTEDARAFRDAGYTAVEASNDNFGDSWPGYVKTMAIVLKRGDEYVLETAYENTDIPLV